MRHRRWWLVVLGAAVLTAFGTKSVVEARSRTSLPDILVVYEGAYIPPSSIGINVVANCPRGRVPSGGGYQLSESRSAWVIANGPVLLDGGGWRIVVRNANTDLVYADAFALCVKATAGYPD